MSKFELGGKAKFAFYYLVSICSIVFLSVFFPDLTKPLWEPRYLIACAVMGVGLGLDVALVTLTLGSQLDNWEKRFLWSMRVAAWHTLFPLVGLTFCLLFANSGGGLNLSIGLAGAVLLFYLYYTFFTEKEEQIQLRVDKTLFREFILIASVSLDSALIGPTLFATTTNWTEFQVCVSYVVAGLVVGLVGSFAALMGSMLSKEKHQRFLDYGRLIEHVIIAYFGWSALLRYGAGIALPGYLLIFLVVLISLLLFKFKK